MVGEKTIPKTLHGRMHIAFSKADLRFFWAANRVSIVGFKKKNRLAQIQMIQNITEQDMVLDLFFFFIESPVYQ